MIEIRDTFQNAKTETPKASMGVRYGEGASPFPIWLGLRERRKLPSGVRRRAPAENGFGAFWAQQNTSLTGKNVKMINCILINCLNYNAS